MIGQSSVGQNSSHSVRQSSHVLFFIEISFDKHSKHQVDVLVERNSFLTLSQLARVC